MVTTRTACLLGALGVLLLLVTLALTAFESISQDSNARCSTVLSSAPSDTTGPDNAGQLRIIDVWPKGRVQLGSRICVAVAGVAASTSPNHASAVDVTLFLNDQRSQLTVKALAVPDRQFLTYDLVQPDDANSDPAKFWRGIVGGKTHDGKVGLTIGLSRTTSTTPEVSAAADKQLELVVYLPRIVFVGAASLLVLIIAFVIFAASTTILRDNDSKDAAGAPDGTFSLGKTQMALWLVLATAGFIFLWLTLGLYLHVITAGILVLLGINGATGLASVAIDNAPAGKSAGFFADITSDSTGPQLHRIQVVAWTLILAAIFVWNVVWKFVFVDFDTNLLLLMGIANAMYLGFKPKEK